MANLAIRGHATRGKEVIEILEMLGGINPYVCKAVRETCFYFIVEGEIDYDEERYITDEYTIFTLEEFLEKFPYKVGDSVSSKYLKNYKIEKAEWESCNNRVIYKLQGMGWYSVEELQPYKEETMDRKYDVEEYLKVWKETEKGLEVVVNDRFELKEDNGKFYIIKKQPQYPKTYEECCDIIEYPHNVVGGYKAELLSSFQNLLICRDVYWKIAGDWKFDFENLCYYLCNEFGSIQKYEGAIDCSAILTFPTKDMRDAFLENFKNLIESCKELL